MPKNAGERPSPSPPSPPKNTSGHAWESCRERPKNPRPDVVNMYNRTEVLCDSPNYNVVHVVYSVPTLVKMLKDLSEEDRMQVFVNFCTKCGSDNPRCTCWNDE